MRYPDPEQGNKIRELRAKGLNQSEIALELGCTQSNISKVSQTHGIQWDIGAAGRDQTGPKNAMYKDGLARSTIERLTRVVVMHSGRSLYACERCGHENTKQEQARHHKDRDRSNNDPSNLEVLCTPCHNREHGKDRVRDVEGKYVE